MTLQFLKGCGKRHGRLLRLAPFVSGESTCLNKGPEAFSPSTHLSLWQQTRTMATKRRQHRHRAKANVGNRGAGIKTSKQNRGNPVSPPKIHRKRPQKSKEPLSIPPSLLVPTASPYVYISGTALGNNTDDEFVLDPSTLFAEVSPRNEEPTSPPPLFAKGDFHYFSPKKDLNYKYPNDGTPEVAFLGRSNVGKSSLINALMRKNLCLTSRTPGRTQLPYYYGLVPKGNEEKKKPHQSKQPISERRDPSTAQGFIVDLPGYGYGRAPTSVAENWQSDTQELLLNRRHEAGVLQRLYLLMDSRRGMEGPNEHDRIVMRWLEDAEIPFTVVLTKADRVSVPLVVKQVNDFCLRFAGQQQYDSDVAQSPVIHVTSSTRGWGIHELMLAIETEFCGDEEDDDFMDPYDTESI